MKNKEFISLKEASEISGYSPDYVGQLIRNGKLPGKQVFQQVVWMTTEEDVRSYMKNKRAVTGGKSENGLITKNTFSKKDRSMEVPQIAVRFLYAIAVVTVCLFLLLFFVFSSSVEHRLNEAAIRASETVSSQ